MKFTQYLKEIREKSLEELKFLEEEARREFFGLKMRWKMGQLKQTHNLRDTKKQLARLLTVIKEKEREKQKNE